MSTRVSVSTEATYSLHFDEDALIDLCKAELIRQTKEVHGVEINPASVEVITPCTYEPLVVEVFAQVRTVHKDVTP